MRLWVVFLALSLGVVSSVAAASASGSYSMRSALESSVRAGDEGARWSLAWAYAEQGDWGRAWGWIERQGAGEDASRAYFKAWLAWRSGRSSMVDSILAEAGCIDARCHQLRLNAFWDLSQWDRARDVARSWFESTQEPEALRMALLASLLAADWEGFDALAESVDWRRSALFASVHSQIRSLIKLRLNF